MVGKRPDRQSEWQKDGGTDSPNNRQTDGQLVREVDRRTTDSQIYQLSVCRQTDGQAVRVEKDGRTDRQCEWQKDGRTDSLNNRQTDRKIARSISYLLNICKQTDGQAVRVVDRRTTDSFISYLLNIRRQTDEQRDGQPER